MWGYGPGDCRGANHPPHDGDHAEQQHEGEEELQGAVPDDGPRRDRIPPLRDGDPLTGGHFGLDWIHPDAPVTGRPAVREI
jgi:hypothetical protein